MLTTTRHRAERAFTMIEVIIAMVLLTIVIGAVVMAITTLGKGNSDSMVDRRAQRQSLDALEVLRQDVGGARSPALEVWDNRREVLRDVVYFGSDSSTDTRDAAHQACAGTPFTACVRDITAATGTQLWMRSSNDRGGACIGYVRDAKGLMRYESTNWRGCGPGVGGAIGTRVIAADGPASAVFRYTLRAHPNIVPRQPADPNLCRTTTGVAAPAAGQLNFITAVDIDFTGIASERNAAAVSSLRTSVPITSRTAGDYAYAVGCAY